MALDRKTLDAGAALLEETLPRARREADAGRGRLIGTSPDILAAAEALAEGRGVALLVRETPEGWTAQLVAQPRGSGPPLLVGTPPRECRDRASAEAAGTSLLAGLLLLAGGGAARPVFLLHGVAVPLLPDVLDAVRAALPPPPPGHDEKAAARAFLDAILTSDFPAGFAMSGLEALPIERRTALMAAVHRAALAGLDEHPEATGRADGP